MFCPSEDGQSANAMPAFKVVTSAPMPIGSRATMHVTLARLRINGSTIAGRGTTEHAFEAGINAREPVSSRQREERQSAE